MQRSHLLFAATLALSLVGCDAAGPADSALASVTLSQDAAIVVNFGRDDNTCFIGGDNIGTASGIKTTTQTASGVQRTTCAGTLTDLSRAPSRAYRGPASCSIGGAGTIVVTPSGRFTVTCLSRP